MHSRELEFSILLPFIGAWWFDLFLTNIDKSHPGAKELLEKGGGGGNNCGAVSHT